MNVKTTGDYIYANTSIRKYFFVNITFQFKMLLICELNIKLKINFVLKKKLAIIYCEYRIEMYESKYWQRTAIL